MHKCLGKNHGSFLRFVPEHSGGWGSPPGLAAGRMAGVSLATKGGRCERSEPIFFLRHKKTPPNGGACSLLVMLCAAL
jgi:hypothetical protein